MLNRLGMASFSLYLIHVPLLRAVKGVCLHLGWRVHTWPAFWAVVIAMFIVVQTAALLTCAWYEIPLQKRFRSLLVHRREVVQAEHAMPRHLLLVVHDNQSSSAVSRPSSRPNPRSGCWWTGASSSVGGAQPA